MLIHAQVRELAGSHHSRMSNHKSISFGVATEPRPPIVSYLFTEKKLARKSVETQQDSQQSAKLKAVDSQGNSFTHGTTMAYSYHHCRCPICKGAWADYHYQYRQSKKDGTFVPKPRGRRRVTPPERPCGQCGQLFRSRRRDAKFCGPECGYDNVRTRPASPVRCVVCGQPASSVRAKTCGEECRAKASVNSRRVA
jgi:hypothetical protein